MQMEKVDFKVNVWHTVAKSFDGEGLYRVAPKDKPGYKDQVLFSLVDGRVMYIPPEVANEIGRLGFKRGEPFQIGKHERRTGQRKGVEWAVQRIEPAEPETPLTRNLRASIDQVKKPCATRSEPAPLWPDDPPPPRPGQPGSQPRPPQPAPTKTKATAASPADSMPGPTGTQHGITTKCPLNLAVPELLKIIVDSLKATGEQWGDASKQDLLSTLLIQAARDGYLCMWERK